MLPVTRKQFRVVRDFDYFRRHNYDVQAPPYNLNLWMENVVNSRKQLHGTIRIQTPQTSGSWTYMNRNGVYTNARNRSYNRLVGTLGDSASFGATLTAERRETFGMVVTIIERATRAVRALKRLNLAAAARELGLPYHEKVRYRKHRIELHPGRDGKRRFRTVRIRETYFDWGTGRERLKTVAGGWLMFSYGIRPLMQDIHAGMDTLQREFPWKRSRGSSTQSTSYSLYRGSPPNYDIRQESLTASVSQACDFRIANPHLYLANRLGLINPVQWAMEAIPFSFIVDWFSNLSDVIGSFAGLDLAGLEKKDPVVNTRVKATFYCEVGNKWENAANKVRADILHTVWTKRDIGLALPVFRLQYERFGWQRGANAASLLVGLLKSR